MALNAAAAADSIGCNLEPGPGNEKCKEHREKIGLPQAVRSSADYTATNLLEFPAICIHCDLFLRGACKKDDTVVTPAMRSGT